MPLLRLLVGKDKWERRDVLALLAVLVALGAGVTAGVENYKPSPEVDLQVDKVEVARTIDIDGVTNDYGVPSVPSKSQTSVIDITLRNSGSSPALITGVSASFSSVKELQNCTGAGPGSSTATYDIKVPTDKSRLKTPFTLERDLRFVVSPNSVDRFQLTVGPEDLGSSAWPWLYQFTLTLKDDAGKTYPVGAVSIVSEGTASWDKFADLPAATFSDPDSRSCLTSNIALLQAAIAAPGLPAPELQHLLSEAQALAQ